MGAWERLKLGEAVARLDIPPKEEVVEVATVGDGESSDGRLQLVSSPKKVLLEVSGHPWERMDLGEAVSDLDASFPKKK